ncbi:MAG TPA: hypothetical protein VFZ61_09730, partial [Polyangiales bacterium]
FPEIPGHRYRAMSSEVQRICEKYGVRYQTGPLLQQMKSVAKAMFRYTLPNAPSDEQRKAAHIPKIQKIQPEGPPRGVPAMQALSA